ncbi:MAG TPA: OmcA/MtrC family decaheme c-type cytochrome [Bryobacteraceae bacterium]|nr:OmcA/MtrC family decaheme c-type cytochrome [Bryobacteraceae bacterium]
MSLRSSTVLIRTILTIMVLAGAVGLQSAGKHTLTKHDKAYFAYATVIDFVRPGLVFKVSSASIAQDGTITARVLVTDPQGLPLDRTGVDTPGTVSMSLIAATIPSGKKQYTSYTTRTVTAASGGATATQASADSGGTFSANADGDYTYSFKTKAPSGFDATATHTVAVYGSRNLTVFNMGTNYASATLNFVPNGGAVTVTRDVVRDQACNKCHYNLAFHGGSRVGVELCVLCHTTQSVDPNTGNTVDFPKLVHEIHMGAASPNAQAGNPYTIYGFNGPTDWHDVTFPGSGSINDPRNCQACHDSNSGAAQANAYLTPNREACGGCHDNVNFATGQNHVNLPQLDDNQCANCHVPQGELPFDASILGAHTSPTEWSGLPGLVINIVKVSNGSAGAAPAITFTLKDGSGNPIPANSLVGGSNRLAVVMAGPTSDYGYTNFGSDVTTHGYVSEDATKATCGTDGTCVYQFLHSIPANATGTFSIGMEGRVGYTINANTNAAVTTEYGAVNKVINFSVDGSPITPRRTVVNIANCNNCHQYLSVHGENRNQIEMCVLCHNPSDTDFATRATARVASDKNAPPQAINFSLMVHKIHDGAGLAAAGLPPFVVVGFGGSHNDFSSVTFPAFSPAGAVGNVQNCSMCHVNGSEANLPLGLNNVTTPNSVLNPTPPITAACTACHATLPELSHAVANTTQFGESCTTCHASGAAFDVDLVHAQ